MTDASGEMLEFTIHTSAADVERAVERWWRSRSRPAVSLVLGLGMAAVLVAMSLVASEVRVLAWLLAGACVVLAIVPFWTRRYTLAVARREFARLGDRDVGYVVTGEWLETTGPFGTVRHPWGSFVRLLRFDDVWLLFTLPAAFCVLPVERVPLGALEAIESHVRGAGVPVK